MHLDPGQALSERGHVLVPDAERRHAHEDQLALEALGGDLAAEHRGGRDEPGRVVRPEVDPHRPVGLRGNPHVADAHRPHAAPIAPDGERRRPRGDPQHLEGESGDQRVPHRRDERQPAHDASRDVGAQEGVAGGAAVDVGHAAEDRPVAPDLP